LTPLTGILENSVKCVLA